MPDYKQSAIGKRVRSFGNLIRSQPNAIPKGSYQVAFKLFDEGAYSDAQDVFQEMVVRNEKKFGASHRKTGYSRYCLGRIFFLQGKYPESENTLKQAIKALEKTRGQEDEVVLECKYFIGRVLFSQNKFNEAKEVFQQTVRGREKILGGDHVDTLSSLHWLGHALYNLQLYDQAEQNLLQAVNGRQRRLSNDDRETLWSKYWLGFAHYRQNNYIKAEEIFEQVVDGYDRTLGSSHVDTLYGKHWLGLTLFNQQKFGEAEAVLQQAAQTREIVLGSTNEETLWSKYWLGRTFFEQGKYDDAAEVLHQAKDGREEVKGSEDPESLNCKHWLGLARYFQGKYNEAEQMLQQAAQGFEKSVGSYSIDLLYSKHWLGQALYSQKEYNRAGEAFKQAVHGQRMLGNKNRQTLWSLYWLGRSLYKQREYVNAEEVIREVADGRTQMLGGNDVNTLKSKFWLGCILYAQKRYSDARQLLQDTIEEQEKTLGSNHQDTQKTMRLLQRIQREVAQSSSKENTIQQSVITRLDSFFPDQQSDDKKLYTDSEIREVSTLLKHFNPHWSKAPRTYIVLRIIGQLDILSELIDLGFSDYWFPVVAANLPHCICPSIRPAFVEAQKTVLTKSIDLEKGANGQHCYFDKEDTMPFERVTILGSGGFGQVDKVLSLITFREYARKRVLRTSAFRKRRRDDISQFVSEIEILKRLKHRHIVSLVGSYTDPKYIGFIMSPVAQMDLATYLTHASVDSSKHAELRTFFGCLSHALQFLHDQKIRHKDIKPTNILIDHGSVLFADFGLSFDFADSNGSTTTGVVNGFTRRYCSPEVALHEPRSTMSDVWSLGVVFLEMTIALKGKTIQYMDDFFKHHGSHQNFIDRNLAAFGELAKALEGTGRESDNKALEWVQQMLVLEPKQRLSASQLAAATTSLGGEEDSVQFCGICCIPVEDDFSD